MVVETTSSSTVLTKFEALIREKDEIEIEANSAMGKILNRRT